MGFTNEQGFFNAINDADTHLIYQYDYYNKKHGDKENIEIYTFGRKHLGLTEKKYINIYLKWVIIKHILQIVLVIDTTLILLW